jgi:hypothetical protein
MLQDKFNFAWHVVRGPQCQAAVGRNSVLSSMGNTGNAFQKCEMAPHIRTVLLNPVASA